LFTNKHLLIPRKVTMKVSKVHSFLRNHQFPIQKGKDSYNLQYYLNSVMSACEILSLQTTALEF
jgi:hypothetical protein